MAIAAPQQGGACNPPKCVPNPDAYFNPFSGRPGIPPGKNPAGVAQLPPHGYHRNSGGPPEFY